MKLVVYSNKALDELEQLVISKFSRIENKDVEIPAFEDPSSFTQKDLCKLFRVKTVKSLNEVNVAFILKNYKHDESKSIDYIKHVLGHKGKNSLLSYLKAYQLATDI